MTYRKLSRAMMVVALGAAAMMVFPTTATAQPRVHQEGYVVECSGAGDGYTAFVTLYENSQFGDEATLRIETADTTLLGGRSDGPFLTDGTIDEIVVALTDDATQLFAGLATVSGSYTVSGKPTRVHDVTNEGEVIVIDVGTRTPLAVDLTLEYAGTTIALDCGPAFAYDVNSLERRFGTPG